MTNKIIFFSFAILFFLTPLFWTPWNYELFEYNKMILTYLITIVIGGAWAWRMVSEKTTIFQITPLHIPLGLFLTANILSTIYSIDPHTSIWGYYSRSNGGLLSIVSYTFLFCAFVSNITKTQTINLLKITLAGGLAVALWAIPEHFGLSPSCLVLRGELGVDCWIQDVQARVFASLGQPNWLAAYMVMLIFPAIYFFITAHNSVTRMTYFLILIAYYLAFTFTFSRGAAVGFLAGIGLFSLVYIFYPAFSEGKNILSVISTAKDRNSLISKNKLFLLLIGSFLVINLIFGSALTRFQLTNLLPQSALQVDTAQKEMPSTITQLENGGTESGQIRLIVWQGALDILKHYPLFGSGVETFAYSYYQFRPVSHNLVSEWDFLYNKAHNEFLNYLATTGIVGFSAYMLVICWYIFWSIRYQFLNIKSKNLNTKYVLLVISLLASYISYLVQNFFGFSVVIIALFFFLFPAIAFVVTDSIKPIQKILTFNFSVFKLIGQRSIYMNIARVFIVIITLAFVYNVSQLWYADTLFAIGQKADEAGNPGKAYNYLVEAVSLNKGEPFYRSELGYAAASSAVALSDSDASLSANLKDQALSQTEYALKTSPHNVSFWTTAVRTYYQLSLIDKSFIQKTLLALDQAIKLSPTNPKLYYNKAIILDQLSDSEGTEDDKKTPNQTPTTELSENTQKAIEALRTAIELKPNYREGYIALALFYYDSKQHQEAVETMGKVLQLVPGDPEALEHLEEWGKKGVATESATKK